VREERDWRLLARWGVRTSDTEEDGWGAAEGGGGDCAGVGVVVAGGWESGEGCWAGGDVVGRMRRRRWWVGLFVLR
jgi:hypothetical protein